MQQHRDEMYSDGGGVRGLSMHQFNTTSGNSSILLQVLRDRDLATAGNLFLVRNESLGDMHEALLEIESILKHGGYRLNKNDQSIVEICITRITTAIRDTRQAEYFANELTRVLNACVLQAAADETSPHAKVASDICNCLFTCHDKRRVMELALPVGIKLLFNNNNNNKQGILAKNMTSYVVLAAASNADVIARYASQLTEATIKGNVSLLRILPQIYAYNPSAVHAHLPAIVRTITRCTPVEKDSLLALLAASFDFINERLAYETATTLLHQLSAATPALVNDIFPVLRRFCVLYPNIVTQLLGDTYRLPDIEVYRAAQELLLNSGNNNDHSAMSNYRRQETDAVYQGVPQPSSRYFYPQAQNYDYSNMTANDAVTDLNRNNGGFGPVPMWKSSFTAPQHPANLGTSALYNYSGGVNNNFERITAAQRRGSRNSLGQLRFGNAVPTTGSTSRERLMQLRTTMNAENQQQPTTWFPSSTYVFDTNHSQTEALPNYAPSNQQVAFSMANNLGGGWASELTAVDRTSRKPTAIGAASHSASSLTNTKKNSFSRSRSRRRNNNNNNNENGVEHAGRGKTRSLSRLTKTLSRNALSNSNVGSRPRTSADSSTNEPSHYTDEQLLQMMPRNRLANLNASSSSGDAGAAVANEMSHVINPILSQDAMQQFCERNMQKIKSYVSSILVKYPLPFKCVVEETAKGRKICKLCFQCQKRTAACLYATPRHSFTIQSNIADIWLHLMFLALQAKSSHQRALGQQDAPVHSLKMTYEHLGLNNNSNGGGFDKGGGTGHTSFAQLATSAFPNAQKLELLLRELKQARYFQVFQYNGLEKRWCCFLCNDMSLINKFRAAEQPARNMQEDDSDQLLSFNSNNKNAVITCEGLLKQFHRSRLLGVQRWKSRYFSLRGRSLKSNHLNKDSSSNNSELDIGTIKCIRITGAAAAASASSGRSNSIGSCTDNMHDSNNNNEADGGAEELDADAAAELREYEADERREAKTHGRCFGFSSFKSDEEDEKQQNEQQSLQSQRRVLEIVTVDDRVMLLQAPDRATAEKWLLKIKMALIGHQLTLNGGSSSNLHETGAVGQNSRDVIDNRASSLKHEDVVDGADAAAASAGGNVHHVHDLYRNIGCATTSRQPSDGIRKNYFDLSAATAPLDRNSHSRRSYVVKHHYTSSDV